MKPIVKDTRSVEERRFAWFMQRVRAALKRGEPRGYEGRVFPQDDAAEAKAKDFLAKVEKEDFPIPVHVRLHDWGQHGWNVALYWKQEVA